MAQNVFQISDAEFLDLEEDFLGKICVTLSDFHGPSDYINAILQSETPDVQQTSGCPAELRDGP